MSLVLDSSTALAWLYQDEVNALAEAVRRRVIIAGAWVPGIWRLEVANGLRTGLRRRRIDQNYRDHALATLAMLNIRVDAETDKQAWSAALQLSDRFGLTSYDAAYLELARRRSLPVATFDTELRDAATSIGLAVIDDD